MQQVNESCTARVSIARMRKSMPALTAGATADTYWNRSVFMPQNTSQWNIMYQEFFKFDTPVTAGAGITTTNSRVRTKDIYIPFNRLMTTNNNQQAGAPENWLVGSGTNDWTMMFIDTDDTNASDSEYLTFTAYFEWVWYEVT